MHNEFIHSIWLPWWHLMPQRVLTTPMLQGIVPKVTCLLEVPCTPSFLSLGIVTMRFKTGVFTGHGEVGDDLPGQGPQRIPALHMVFHGQFGWVVEIV